MKTFRLASQEYEPERFILDVLPWVYEAGSPYFDRFFGGVQAARLALEKWMIRTSSEVSIRRMTLLFEENQVIGGFIGLGGAELQQCRKADTLAAMKEVDQRGRSALLARMSALRNLFAPIKADEFYLSKMGVRTDRRGEGLGRELVLEYLVAGHAKGFQRFRLDVWVENRRAIRLYESVGFQIVSCSASEKAEMRYLAMAL